MRHAILLLFGLAVVLPAGYSVLFSLQSWPALRDPAFWHGPELREFGPLLIAFALGFALAG